MKYIALILTFCLSQLVSQLAFAADSGDYNPEALIKYRQDTMHAIQGHNNAIKAIIDGKVPYTNQLGMHMAALNDLFKQLSTFFPEGSDMGETEAKDEIWDNPRRFRETVDKAKEALMKFDRVVKQGDRKAARRAVRKFGKASCGNCHKLFKKKDDDDDHDHDHDHDD